MGRVPGNAITLNRNDQSITTGLRKTQQAKMPGMNDIKMAGNKNRSILHYQLRCDIKSLLALFYTRMYPGSSSVIHSLTICLNFTFSFS